MRKLLVIFSIIKLYVRINNSFLNCRLKGQVVLGFHIWNVFERSMFILSNFVDSGSPSV